MFDFQEVESKKIKQLEQRIFELDNQVKHWRSLYEQEIKKRPKETKYISSGSYNDKIYKRTVEILRMMMKTEDVRNWRALAIDLMELYGFIASDEEEYYGDLL